MFSLLSCLFRRARADNPAPGARAEPPAATANEPLGCGWFDSSHELLSGVTVWEGIIVVDNTVAHPT